MHFKIKRKYHIINSPFSTSYFLLLLTSPPLPFPLKIRRLSNHASAFFFMLLFLITKYYRSNDPRDTPRPNAVVFFLGGKAKKKRKKKESFTAKTKPGISKFSKATRIYTYTYIFPCVLHTGYTTYTLSLCNDST